MSERVLHARAGPATLGVVRAAIFVAWLVVVVPDPLSFLGSLPREMLVPIGLLRLVPDALWAHLLEPGALEAFKLVLATGLVLSAIGARPYTPIALVTAVLLTLHQGLLRSFTFDNHEELALLVCTWVLAIFPAADGFALPRRRSARRAGVYPAALLAMTAFLLLPYCAIAAHRLTHAAPAVFTGDSLPFWLASLHSLDRESWGAGLWILEHPALVPLFKAAFAVTTVFELLAPLCLILPRFRRVWVVVVVGFHVVNWFTLNLLFWQNTVLVLLLVTDPEAWLGRLLLARPPVHQVADERAGAPPLVRS